MELIKQMACRENLSNTEKAIVDYIFLNADDILNMSISTLANNTYSSNVSIIRLCKKLGLSGFREFKIEFAKALVENRNSKKYIDYNYPFHLAETPYSVANDIAILTKSSIDVCLKHVDFKLLEKISTIILERNKCYIFATGDSLIRATSFENKLMKIGIDLINTHRLFEGNSYSLYAQKNDCAIFITYSASNTDFLRSAHILKSKGVPIIVITANEDTTLCKLADYLINFPNLENNIDSIATFYSQIALEYILNVLYSLIFSKNYSLNKEKKHTLDVQRNKR